MFRQQKLWLWLVVMCYGSLLLSSLHSCSSDCDKNSVLAYVTLVNSRTQRPLELGDTLTITATNSGQPILNKGIQMSQFALPLQYQEDHDTLQFNFFNQNGVSWQYQVSIEHSRKTHFESTDCPMVVFHQLKKIDFQTASLNTPLQIDSIKIVRPTVDYDNSENIRIYFSTIAHQ